MILPTKHISVQDSILGIGAILITQMEQPMTVSSLWDRVRDDPRIATFERFTLALDLLFLLGIIQLKKDKLRRVST